MTPTLRAAAAAALALGGLSGRLPAAETGPASVLSAMEKVAAWQIAHPSHWPEDDWTQGAGDAGLSALAALSGDPRFEQALLQKGARLAWKPGPRPYHADDVVVAQAFEELYMRRRDPALLSPLRTRFDWVLAHPPQQASLDFSAGYDKATDLWSWCDSLFMAPPAWVRMGAATGDDRYTEYGVRNWWRTTDYLYDTREHLFFRDSTYFQKREANGQKVFWSRGNGWVLAGLARMLEYLPANHPDRPRFEALFREMAGRVLSCQQADGLWRASLLDPASYPMRETSGSGFFTFALAWGVNEGLLPAAEFSPAVRKGWKALLGCVGADGRLGFVQPVGADPKSFPPDSTEPYGVGAFLLAGSEIYKMEVLAGARPLVAAVSNPSDYGRCDETVAAAADGIDPSSTAVLDGASARVLDSQAWTDEGGRARILFKADLAPRETRKYLLVPRALLAGQPAPVARAYARQVAERFGDLAWESDRIAHRMYSVALIKGEGTVSSGIDVWTKRTRALVVDEWYRRPNYHQDDGDGLDDYQVGRSRGCGGIGVWSGGRLWVSINFASARVLAAGPIRSEFELGYDAWDADGRKISEVKRIRIDAGSNFSRARSLFTADGPGPLAVGIGIARRSDPAAVEAGDAAAGWMTQWQAPDRDRGSIACAVVLPGGGAGFADESASVPAVPPDKRLVPGAEGIPPVGNRLLLATLPAPASPGPFELTYYFGAGWSRSGDFPDEDSWEACVRRFADCAAHPLSVDVSLPRQR